MIHIYIYMNHIYSGTTGLVSGAVDAMDLLGPYEIRHIGKEVKFHCATFKLVATGGRTVDLELSH